MKTMVAILALSSTPLLLSGEARQLSGSTSFSQSMIMTVSEDGNELADMFEHWEISGDFVKPTLTCSVLAASFTVRQDMTYVHLWSHTAQRVTEIRPGIFRVEMNGRLNPFSGLELVVELNGERSRITETTGSMRSGSRGQSIRTFHIDRKSKTRKLLPLYNPSWNPRKN